MSRLDAPWTPQQVDALNAYQTARMMHPYTCDGVKLVSRRRCRRVLVATQDGWHCPRFGCRYRQAWAHDWTAGEWLLKFEERAAGLEDLNDGRVLADIARDYEAHAAGRVKYDMRGDLERLRVRLASSGKRDAVLCDTPACIEARRSPDFTEDHVRPCHMLPPEGW